MEEKKDSILETKSSRRSFLKNSGIAVGGLVLGGSLATLFTNNGEGDGDSSTEHPTDGGTTAIDYNESLQFFRRKQDFEAIAAAMETIYPEDSNGPGAIKLGAPYYLDKQLAGPWGMNADDYRKAPFQPGEVPLNNADIFLEGARMLNQSAKDEYDSDLFVSLTEEQKIELLTKFEKGEIDMKYVPSPMFFTMLRAATLQGCFCDPMYGGNKDMQGWVMKEHPGAQPNYAQYVEKEEFLVIPPISVGGHKHNG